MNEGGIIGKQNTTTATSASGMWTVNEVFLRNTVNGEWPNFNVPSSVSYSILSGGGSGSGPVSISRNCFGGGSGAIPVEGTFAPASGTTYVVTVGAGGGRTNSYNTLTSGGTSSITGIATGNAGRCENTESGSPNADFVGGFPFGGSGPSGTGAAGGGGAGAGEGTESGPLQGQSYQGGRGGNGVVMPLHPTSLRIGGGGGGGGPTIYTHGAASDGGGKSGHSATAPGANRGGGGGGATQGSSSNEQNGGSGRVIFRYSDAAPAATTTGSVTVTVSGGYRYYDFTSSGTFGF